MLALALLAIASPRILHAAGADPSSPSAVLRFERDGALVRALPLAALRAACPTERVDVDDPYYHRAMSFFALPFPCVFEAGFGAPLASSAREDFSLRALDGYARPVAGAQLAEPGAWLAFADASLTPRAALDADPPALRFAPITRRELDPAPFYLVWTGAEQNDPHRHPWPFQLVTIDEVPFARRHPHTVPTGEPPGSPAQRGFSLFRSQCIACHAINGEGGAVGPDLNVPRSIVEYRPVAQIRAFIRDPRSFRYSAMPAHPGLTDADLDALVAYFRAMSARKHDPGGAGRAAPDAGGE